jgi:hypothetical protein
MTNDQTSSASEMTYRHFRDDLHPDMSRVALYGAIGERRAPEGKASPERPVRLGDWAAVLVDKTVVVAIEERTCLTLVFQIRPLVGFRDRFAAALRRGLHDRRVAPEAIELECRAVHEAVLVRRRHPALVEALEFAEFEAGAHVGCGQEGGSVQDMLKEYPYGGCPTSCPKSAVTMLFAGRAGTGPRQPAKPGVPVPTVTRS